MQSEQAIREVITELDKFQLELGSKIKTYDELHLALARHLNFLITNNFSLLISILYRLDISEKKLTQYLKESAQVNAGNIIAQLIIERQLQKLEARKHFSNNSTHIPDEERW